MEVRFTTNGFTVIYENESEKDYLKTVLDRIGVVYKPTYTTCDHGIKIVGRPDED